MTDIITKQDAVIAIVQGLIDDETLAGFTVEDNEIRTYNLPLVIVDLVDSSTQPLSSGEVCDSGYSLKLIVIDALRNHSDTFRTTRNYVRDSLYSILGELNVDIEDNKVYHEDGIYGQFESSRAYTIIKY